jgi:hypothetical protein
MELTSAICFRCTLVNTVRFLALSRWFLEWILDLLTTFNIQLVITLNYSTIADLDTLQTTVTHTSVLSLLPDVSWKLLLTLEILQLLHSQLIWMAAPFQLSTLGPTMSSLHRLTGRAKSQSYSMTGTLPPINLSWHQAPWDPQTEIFFFKWTFVVTALMKHPLWQEDGFVSFD